MTEGDPPATDETPPPTAASGPRPRLRGSDDDPLGALVRLVQQPSPTNRAPSEELARWARAEESRDGGRRADDAPSASAPPAGIPARSASAALSAPSGPFEVLSLDAIRASDPGVDETPAAAESEVVPRQAEVPPVASGEPVGPAGRTATALAADLGTAPDPDRSTTSRSDQPASSERVAGALVAVPVEASPADAAVPTDQRPGVDAPAAAPVTLERDPIAPGRAHGSLGPGWTWGFPALIVVLALLLPVLVVVGQNAVLQSTDGRVLSTVSDPSAPGWQAITDPTPTMLVVQTDVEGTATGLTVLSLTGDESGGIMFIPMTTVLELAGIGNIPLDAAAERAGLEGLQKAVEGVLGVGMGEVAAIDPQGWADLLAPLGTLDVENPDDVSVAGENGEKVIVFPKGTITLTPAEVAAYLETLSPGENDLNRLVRHQAFWEAWLRQVGTSPDPGIVPGESASGLGRFIRELASDRVDMAPLPVRSAMIPGSDLAVYLPVADQVTSLVARLVPFPIGAPPGARPRVRLLDGAGSLDHGLGAVGAVVAAGGQVDQIGNADTFDVAVTTFEYSDEARLPEVERLRSGIGVGDIVKVPPGQTAIDVTIVLGADYRARTPPSSAPVTTAVR